VKAFRNKFKAINLHWLQKLESGNALLGAKVV